MGNLTRNKIPPSVYKRPVKFRRHRIKSLEKRKELLLFFSGFPKAREN